jgi:excisionase family DNA binding protein
MITETGSLFGAARYRRKRCTCKHTQVNAARKGLSPPRHVVRRSLQALTDTLSLCDDQGVTERRYLTTGEAARALDVNPTTLQRWVHKYGIKPAYITGGGHFRWDLDALRRQLQQRHPGLEVPPVTNSHPASTPEHQPVVAAIVTSHLGVLVGRRNDGKPPWTFIAGEIEPGESQVDAAVREVKEETGLRVRAGHHEIGRRVHPKTGRTMIYLACTPTEGTDIFVGDPDELAEVRWANLADVDTLMGRTNVFGPVWEHLARVLA